MIANLLRTAVPKLAAGIVLSSVLAAASMPSHAAPGGFTPRDGDIIFHTSRSSQSAAIQRATNSPWSHMGVIFMRAGKPFVLEASATVRYTALSTWIANGAGERYVIKRWRAAPEGLTHGDATKLRLATEAFIGRRYDLQFGWSDAKLYCSELVWKAYDRALGVRFGDTAPMGSFDFSDPSVQSKVAERFGQGLPADEPVIAPSAMFDSELLIEVARR